MRWSRGGMIVQSLFQALWLALWIVWPFARAWTWIAQVFLTLHTLALFMKVHSYAFYNGHLSTTLVRLKQLDRPVGPTTPTTAAVRYPTPITRLHPNDKDEDVEPENTLSPILQLREDLAKELTSPLGNVTYPQNLTVANFADYMLCPTLCYELEYPRTPSRSYMELFYKTLAVFGCIFLMTVVSEEFIIPVLDESALALFHSKTFLDSALIFAETVSRLLFPFMITFLLVFLVIFEYVLGAFAEITKFADRQFYSDWWNSLDWLEFSREWNIPVHNFFHRHVYGASRGAHMSRASATAITFFVSAVAHELVMGCITRKFRGYGFFFMMLQIPFVAIQRTPWVRSQQLLNNVMFWIFMIMGLSLLIYRVRHLRGPLAFDSLYTGSPAHPTLPPTSRDPRISAATGISGTGAAMQHHSPGAHRSRLRHGLGRQSFTGRMATRKSSVGDVEDHVLADVRVDMVHPATAGRIYGLGAPGHAAKGVGFRPEQCEVSAHHARGGDFGTGVFYLPEWLRRAKHQGHGYGFGLHVGSDLGDRTDGPCLQTQAPKVKDKLDEAADDLDELEHVIAQLKQRKHGNGRAMQEWIDELAETSPVSEVRPGATAAIRSTSVAIPAVVTERYLADLTRKLKRARHKKARFMNEWSNLCQRAQEAQKILDAATSRKLDSLDETPSRSTLWARFNFLTPMMRFHLYMHVIPAFRTLLSVIFALASVMVVWSEVIKPFNEKISIIGLTVVHHPKSETGKVGFAGQSIAALWLLYMDACALYAIQDVKVWGNRALVKRQTYAESACWYSLQVSKLTVPLSYNFITMLPWDVYRETSFFQFLGQLIVLTPLGNGFSRFFPCFILLPVLASAFNVYGRIQNIIGFGVLEDDHEASAPGFGTGGWREGRALIERELQSRGAGATVGLASRGASLDAERRVPTAEAAAASRPLARETLLPAHRTPESTTRQPRAMPSQARNVSGADDSDDSPRAFYQDFGERVRNTFESVDRPEWMKNMTFSPPKWMRRDEANHNGGGGGGGAGGNAISRWFGGRAEEGRNNQPPSGMVRSILISAHSTRSVQIPTGNDPRTTRLQRPHLHITRWEQSAAGAMLHLAEHKGRYGVSVLRAPDSLHSSESSLQAESGSTPETTTDEMAGDENSIQELLNAVDIGNNGQSSNSKGKGRADEPMRYHANNFDLTWKEHSAEIDRKRLGAQPDIQYVLDLGFHERHYTMVKLEEHLCEVTAALEFQDFFDMSESHCLLLEGRRTASWPRVPLYAVSSLIEWQDCEGRLVLTWFATYHDRDSVQTMLKSLIGQLIHSMHSSVRLPRPEDFLQDKDLESTESLLQLFRLLLQDQLECAPVILTIEGVEQYQLPGPEPRKPELDKFLNCLSAIIDEDFERQNPTNHPLKVLLTAHYKFIGTYPFSEDRYTRLNVREMFRRFKLPAFGWASGDGLQEVDRPVPGIGILPDPDAEWEEESGPEAEAEAESRPGPGSGPGPRSKS
nr:putative sterol o-acyltransferase 2 [Quercus suber]